MILYDVAYDAVLIKISAARPCVPNGSLKSICTLAMLSRFHSGARNLLANLMTTRFCVSSLPR